MKQEINVAVHELKSGFHQVSFIHPIELRRIRRRFRVALEARQYVEFIKKRFSANGLNASSALTVSELLKMFAESNQNSKLKRLSMGMFLSFVDSFGKTPAMEITKDDLVAWMNRLKEERNLATTTLENIRCYVSPFFEFLVDSGVLRENPFAKVVIPRRRGKKHEKLNEVEIKDLLGRVKTTSPDLIYPMTYFLAQTGCRLGEARELKWEHVNFDNETVQLNDTKPGGDRQIQMSPQLQEFLKNHPRKSEHVFVNQHGEKWRVPQYRKQFQNVRAEIGFNKHWTNHGFRHSFAFNYLRQGGDMRQLQHILGHNKLQMTVDLYGKITPVDIKAGSPFEF